jgi:hypothetical protein
MNINYKRAIENKLNFRYILLRQLVAVSVSIPCFENKYALRGRNPHVMPYVIHTNEFSAMIEK